MHGSSSKGYLNGILRGKITEKIAELAHHTPQQHRGVMSGKIQTGQTPLINRNQEKQTNHQSSKNENKKQTNKKNRKRRRERTKYYNIIVIFFFLSLKEDVCQLVDMPNTCTSGHKSNEHDLNAIKF